MPKDPQKVQLDSEKEGVGFSGAILILVCVLTLIGGVFLTKAFKR